MLFIKSQEVKKMSKESKSDKIKPKINIDGKELEFEPGETILQIAERSNIYIPKLCYIEGLTPYGGCRLCIVKVEGDPKPYQTSCSTPARDGMKIITKDDELQSMRKETLQLILSEHPSNCLICGHNKTCDDLNSQPTKIPSSRIFGCFSCASKYTCELREICNYLNIDKLDYEFHYKNHKPKTSEPFILRDYNLCINCGRCVRICSELRGINAIDFMFRGYNVYIGSSISTPLVDSNCIFCGACVDICPVGVYTAKKPKWVYDRNNFKEGFCIFCNMDCKMNYYFDKVEEETDSTQNYRLIESIPSKNWFNKGQACVIGRFCIPDIVLSPIRIKSPLIKSGYRFVSTTWENVYSTLVRKLKEFDPNEIAIIASPDLTNESAFLLYLLGKKILKTQNIAINTHDYLITNIYYLKNLSNQKRLYTNINVANNIILIETDVQNMYQVLLVDLIKAKNRGANLIAIHSNELDLPNETKRLLNKEIVVSQEEVPKVIEKLKSEYNIDFIILGSYIYPSITKTIVNMFENSNATIIPLSVGSNIEGVGSLFPTPISKIIDKIKSNQIKLLIITERIDNVIKDMNLNIDQIVNNLNYLVTIDIYENEFMNYSNIILPASTYLEDWGSIVNFERKIIKFDKVMDPLFDSKPDRLIFSEIISYLDNSIAKDLNNLSEAWFDNNNEYKDMINNPPNNSETIEQILIKKVNVPNSWRNYKFRGMPIYKLVDDLRFIIEHRESTSALCEEKIENIKEYKPSENSIDFYINSAGILSSNGVNYGLSIFQSIINSIKSANFEFNLILDENNNVFNYYKEDEFCLCNNYKRTLEYSNAIINLSKYPINCYIKYKNPDDGKEQYEFIDKLLLLKKEILSIHPKKIIETFKKYSENENNGNSINNGMQMIALLAAQQSSEYATLINKSESSIIQMNKSKENKQNLPDWYIWNPMLHLENMIDKSVLKSIFEKQQIIKPIVDILPDKCIGCNRCINICPHNAIDIFYSSKSWVYENKIPNISKITTSKCFKCTTCIPHCPVNAIIIKKW